MKKNFFIISLVSVLFLIVTSGCTKSGLISNISVKEDSKYVETFKELNLGVLQDYNLKLMNADKTWVNIWVEKYVNGKQEPEPLTQLSYGNSPEKVAQGSIVFGMINPHSEEPIVILNGPGVSVTPHKIEKLLSSIRVSGWETVIGEKEVELELGETYLLGAYRVNEEPAITTYDLQKEEEIQKMINDDDVVLLLKLKIEESVPF